MFYVLKCWGDEDRFATSAAKCLSSIPTRTAVPDGHPEVSEANGSVQFQVHRDDSQTSQGERSVRERGRTALIHDSGVQTRLFHA